MATEIRESPATGVDTQASVAGAPQEWEPSRGKRRWWLIVVPLVVLLVGWWIFQSRTPQVTYAEVRRGPMTLSVAASGKVDGDASDLGFTVNGTIIESRVHEGQAVEAQQLLARIDRSNFSGTDDVILAPYDGYVVAVYRKVGEVVGPGIPVLRVVRGGGVFVTAYVDSEDAAWIVPGDRFVCRAGGYLARAWALQVQGMGYEAVPREDVAGSARQVRIPMRVLDADFSLPIGTPVDVDGEVTIAKDALQIPASAVVRDEDRNFVWRLDQGHVERAEVKLGPNNFQNVVINSGLHVGDHIVVEGKTDLAAGEHVRAEPWEEPQP